jgi:hypothetical protein
MTGSSMPTQDGHPDGQATPDLSTPTKDGHPYNEATPNSSDVMPMPCECHFTRAEGGNQMALAN